MSKRTWDVPEGVMIRAAGDVQRKLEKTIEHFITYELEQVKANCGPQYAHVPLDDIRVQASNIRKRGMLGPVKGKGPSKYEVPPDMVEYYKTLHWKDFSAKVREFWGFSCAICYKSNVKDVHHRTYDRLGHELLTDCVLVCRPCHKEADKRRRRQKEKDGNGLF